MRESLTEVIVGAAVLVAAGGFIAFTANATGYGTNDAGLVLTASFRSVEGIDVGTDVRLAGVQIGRVADMALNTQSYRADTTLALDSAVPIPNDSSAVVASEGLLGGSFIEIVPGGSLDNFVNGEEIVDTQGAVSLLQLLLTYVAGGDEA